MREHRKTKIDVPATCPIGGHGDRYRRTVAEAIELAELRHLTRTTIIAETVMPAAGLAEVGGVHDVRSADGRVTFDVDSDRLDAVVQVLATLGVRSLAAHPPTLEELFLRQYGEQVGGEVRV